MADQPESLADVRNKLSQIVEEVVSTHRRVPVTKHGKVAAYLVAADDLAVLEQRIEELSVNNKLIAVLNRAQQAIKDGDFATLEDLDKQLKRRM